MRGKFEAEFSRAPAGDEAGRGKCDADETGIDSLMKSFRLTELRSFGACMDGDGGG